MVFDLYYGVWRIKNALISSGVLSHTPQACAVCLRFEPVAGDAWKEGGPSERCLSSSICPQCWEHSTSLCFQLWFRNYVGNMENVLLWRLQTLSTIWYQSVFRQLHFQFFRDNVFARLFLKSILTVPFWALITYVSKQGWICHGVLPYISLTANK